MEIKNEHIEEILFGYFSGDLSADQEKDLLEWLESDESNQKILSEMADWWALAHVPLFVSDKKPHFEKHFGNLNKKYFWNKTDNRVGMWSKIAASVLLLISVGTLSFLVGRSEIGRNQEVAYFETVTPMGANSKVILPDQTVVWINAGSSLKYSKDFNQKNRVVLLEGEAYFEVQPDSLKPFIVKSEMLDIQVLGTHFDVKAYPDEQFTDVSLVSGKVNIQLNDDNYKSGEVILTPDRMFSFNKETKCVQVVEIKGKDAYAWTDGAFKFAEQPFFRIAKDLERKFNVQIQIESESLRKEIFSGSFSAEYTLDEILREVDVDHKYVWKRNGDKILIRDK